MFAKDLKKKETNELEKMVCDARKELEKLRADIYQNKGVNMNKIKNLKKDCARMLTALSDRRKKSNV